MATLRQILLGAAVAILGTSGYLYLSKSGNSSNPLLEDAEGQEFKVVSYQSDKKVGCRKVTEMVVTIDDTTYTFTDKDARVSLKDDESKIKTAELEGIVIKTASGTKTLVGPDLKSAPNTVKKCNALYRDLTVALKQQNDEGAEDIHVYHPKLTKP